MILGVPWILACLLLSSDTAVPTSPPASPFSWRSTADAADVPPVVTNSKILGEAKQRSSMSLVLFHDERPYGGRADETAWLVAYDVPVPAPDQAAPANVMVFVLISLKGRVIAAFTEAAPIWVKSFWSNDDITSRAAESWEFSPVDSDLLRSSIADVLGAVWRQDGVNPTQAGQITIRPRKFHRKITILTNGKQVRPPIENGWLVEVLGTNAGMNRFGTAMSIHLIVLRDRDLEFSGGLLL